MLNYLCIDSTKLHNPKHPIRERGAIIAYDHAFAQFHSCIYHGLCSSPARFCAHNIVQYAIPYKGIGVTLQACNLTIFRPIDKIAGGGHTPSASTNMLEIASTRFRKSAYSIDLELNSSKYRSRNPGSLLITSATSSRDML